MDGRSPSTLAGRTFAEQANPQSHETIGKGRIGTASFAELLTYAAPAGIPVIVETPSVDHEGHTADIALLKTLRSSHPGG